MNFKITNHAEFKKFGGGKITCLNVTKYNCAATLKANYTQCSFANIISLAHFPHTAVLIEYDDTPK